MQTSSTVRQPRAGVFVNGTLVNWERIEVVNFAYNQSDSFLVHLPLFDPNAPFDWAFWSSSTDIEVKIGIGFQVDGNTDLTTVIVGSVKRVDLVVLPAGHEFGGVGAAGGGAAYGTKGAYLAIAGNDYAAELMNSPFTHQFVGENLTAKDIAQQIVSNHPQLSLQMQGGGNSVGADYNAIPGRLLQSTMEWDALTSIADFLGMKARVEGRNVIIAPATSSDSGSPYQLYYYPATADHGPRSNCISLRFARNLAIAAGVTAIVRSHDMTDGAAVVTGTASTGNGGPTYTYDVGQMTKPQAQQLAEARLGEITSYERDIEFEIPGDPALKVSTSLSLTGTGTEFDQAYKVAQVAHLISPRRGYVMQGIGRAASQGGTTAGGLTPGT